VASLRKWSRELAEKLSEKAFDEPDGEHGPEPAVEDVVPVTLPMADENHALTCAFNIRDTVRILREC
jgi:hypothetical protein